MWLDLHHPMGRGKVEYRFLKPDGHFSVRFLLTLFVTVKVIGQRGAGQVFQVVSHLRKITVI